MPDRAPELLRALGRRFALVGCISGRRAIEARELVGVEEIAYAGNHGLELLLPGEDEPGLDPALAGRELAAAELLAGIGEERWRRLGCGARTRDRSRPCTGGVPATSRRQARAYEIAALAGRAELEPRWGRKVLELRPVGCGGKDAAVTALLGGAEIVAVAYAGDDRTDLDAFRRLRELRDDGRLHSTACIGVASAEAPPELAGESDVVVDGPAGWLAMLEALAN